MSILCTHYPVMGILRVLCLATLLVMGPCSLFAQSPLQLIDLAEHPIVQTVRLKGVGEQRRLVGTLTFINGARARSGAVAHVMRTGERGTPFLIWFEQRRGEEAFPDIYRPESRPFSIPLPATAEDAAAASVIVANRSDDGGPVGADIGIVSASSDVAEDNAGSDALEIQVRPDALVPLTDVKAMRVGAVLDLRLTAVANINAVIALLHRSGDESPGLLLLVPQKGPDDGAADVPRTPGNDRSVRTGRIPVNQGTRILWLGSASRNTKAGRQLLNDLLAP